MEVGEETWKFEIWRLAGHQDFWIDPSGYYKRVQGVVVVYDVTNRKSFKNLAFWVKEAKIHSNDDPDLKIMIVGNKADLIKER